MRNNPINFNDPSGHDDECANDPICSQLLATFVEAAIDMESPIGNTRPRFNIFGIIKNGYYSGIGPAKISDAEMEGKRGKIVDEEHIKVGLGLRNESCDNGCDMDQAKPEIAAIAMEVRLSLRLDVCVQNGCTKTDMFMVALLAGDERITPKDLNNAFKNYEINNGVVTLDWEQFLLKNWTRKKDRDKNKDLINLFTKNVKKIDSQLLSESEWNYVGGVAAQ